jgi:hypothetical protein
MIVFLSMVSFAGVLLAGCGGARPVAGPSASPKPVQPPRYPAERETSAQIIAGAIAATRGASTVRVTGDVWHGHDQISIDVTLDGTKGGYGVAAVNGRRVHLIRIRRAVYFRAGASFYRHEGVSPAAASIAAGQWIRIPASAKGANALIELTSTKLLRVMLPPGADGSMTKLPGIHLIGGTPAVGLRDSSGGMAYVAARGKPYLLEITVVLGGHHMEVRFSEYGKPVKLPFPPNVRSIS